MISAVSDAIIQRGAGKIIRQRSFICFISKEMFSFKSTVVTKYLGQAEVSIFWNQKWQDTPATQMIAVLFMGILYEAVKIADAI